MVKQVDNEFFLSKNNWVSKRNVLNEMRAKKMTLQEVRFFSIYLSKINPADISTRVLKFTVRDFAKIMDIDRVRIENIKETTDNLLCKIITVPNESGGYSSFQLFKECELYKEDNIWFVKIDAHDKALPLLFDFKEKYFKYRLWNALNLSSAQQIRIYEVLKQYESIGTRTLSLDELKEMIGISSKQYTRFNSFREWVLDRAKYALAEKTDICFEYKTVVRGGRKVVGIEFIIHKNKKHISKKTTLDEFITSTDNDLQECDDSNNVIDYQGYAEMFDDIFSVKQIKLLYQLAVPVVKVRTTTANDFELEMYNYMRLLNAKLNSSPNDVKHKFAYVKKLVECDYQQCVFER